MNSSTRRPVPSPMIESWPEPSAPDTPVAAVAAEPGRRRWNPATLDATLIGYSMNVTQATRSVVDANVARTRKNLETAMIGRSSGMNW